MDRRDPLLLAAIVGLCANPKIAGTMPPAKVGALAVSIAKAADAKIGPAEDEVPPEGERVAAPRATRPAPVVEDDGPKRGTVELHKARHPHD